MLNRKQEDKGGLATLWPHFLLSKPTKFLKRCQVPAAEKQKADTSVNPKAKTADVRFK